MVSKESALVPVAQEEDPRTGPSLRPRAAPRWSKYVYLEISSSETDEEESDACTEGMNEYPLPNSYS